MNAKLKKIPDQLGIENAKNNASTSDHVVEHIQISPFIESMKSSISIPSDLGLKREYAEYIFNKGEKADQ
jgi:hypothetical protein